MENYINDGVVTFDKADRSEGTKATIACNEGFVLEDGASEFTCKGGLWLDDVNNPSSSSDFIVTRCNSGETCTFLIVNMYPFFRLYRTIQVLK